MANINLLRGKMAEAGSVNFVTDLAILLNISRGAASNKMNNKAPFKDAEIATLAKEYNMTPEDVKNIFITK